MSDTYQFRLIKIDSTTYDFTANVIPATIKKTRNLFKADSLEPSTSTCSFSVDKKEATLLNYLENTTDEVKIVIYKNGVAWFTGYVADNYELKITSKGGIQSFEIQLDDVGKYLLQRLWISSNGLYTSFTGKYLINTASQGNSILHIIATLAGITVNASVASSDIIIPYGGVKDADGSTYWDILKSLLFEYGYLFTIEDDGTLSVYDFAYDISSSSQTFKSSEDIRGEISAKTNRWSNSFVKLTWCKYKLIALETIFHDTTGATAASDCVIEVAAGGYYPTDADADTLSSIAYADDDSNEILDVGSATADIKCNAAITWEFNHLGSSGQLRFKNTDTMAKHNITQIKVGGVNVLVKSSDCKTYAGNQTKKVKPYEYSAQYIHTEAYAKQLSKVIYSYLNNAQRTLHLISSKAYLVGSSVQVTDDIYSSLSALCIITNRVEKVREDGQCNQYEYDLVTCGQFSTGVATKSSYSNTEGSVNNSKTSSTGSLVTAISKRVSYADAVAPGGYVNPESGATNNAAQVSAPVLSGSCKFRTAYLQWDRASNLTGAVSYNVYHSLDNEAWSLIASVASCAYIATDLSLGGTDAEPESRGHYFKITRAVNSTEGDDSNTVHLTASPISSGDIEAQSVTAEKIDTEVLNALIANINSQLTISDVTGFTAGDLASGAAVGKCGAYLDVDEIRLKEKRSSGWLNMLSLYLSGPAGVRNARIAFGNNENARLDWDERSDAVLATNLRTAFQETGSWTYSHTYSAFTQSGIAGLSSACDLPNGVRVLLRYGSGYSTGMTLLYYDKSGTLIKTLDLGLSGHSIGNVSRVRAFANGYLGVIYTDSTESKFKLLIVSPTYDISVPILIFDLHPTSGPNAGTWYNVLTGDMSCKGLNATVIYQIDTQLFRNVYTYAGELSAQELLVTNVNGIPANTGTEAQLSVCHNLSGVEYIAYRNNSGYISIFIRQTDGTRTITSSSYKGKGPIIRLTPNNKILLVYSLDTGVDSQQDYLYASYRNLDFTPADTYGGNPYDGFQITGQAYNGNSSRAYPQYTKELCIDYSGAITIYYSSSFGSTTTYIRATGAAYSFPTISAANGSLDTNSDGTITKTCLDKVGSGIIAQGQNSSGYYVVFSSGYARCFRVYVTGTMPANTNTNVNVYPAISFSAPVAGSISGAMGTAWTGTITINGGVSTASGGYWVVNVNPGSTAQAVALYLTMEGFVNPADFGG